MEKSYLGTYKINEKNLAFPYEPAKTEFFVYKDGENILFSKKKIRGRELMTKVCVRKRKCWEYGEKTYFRTYIHTGKILANGSTINIYKSGDKYVLSKARGEAAKKCSKSITGKVRPNNYVDLAKYSKTLFAKGSVEMEVCITEKNAYCRLRPVENSSLPTLGNLSHINGNKYGRDLTHFKVQIATGTARTKRVRLPMAFSHKANAKPGDILPVYLDEDGCLIIEGAPGACAACGKTIRRMGEISTSHIVAPQTENLLFLIRTEEEPEAAAI